MGSPGCTGPTAWLPVVPGALFSECQSEVALKKEAVALWGEMGTLQSNHGPGGFKAQGTRGPGAGRRDKFLSLTPPHAGRQVLYHSVAPPASVNPLFV
jgi:hypothetical protein